jgi:DNA-directed RNA polymerase III subunit RPC3
VALRNQQCVDLAKLRLGETPSCVYEQLLLHIEGRIPRCRSDTFCDDPGLKPDIPLVTTTELLAQLPPDFDLASGIGKVGTKVENRSNGTAPRFKDPVLDDDDDDDIVRPVKRQRVTFEDESHVNGEAQQSRTTQLKNHLDILAADTCGFVSKISGDNHGTWSVDYEALADYMRTAELDKMILENHGPYGHRLVRMMKKVGKLEEKMSPNIGLLKQSDIRTKLAEMHMAGIVDIQEISRDAQHTIARTIFLWYFDTQRVRAIYLDRLFKSMTKCLQRLESAKEDAKDELLALKREDVKGLAPEEFLQPASLQRLATYQHTEDALLTQIGRLDSLISLFQDY